MKSRSGNLHILEIGKTSFKKMENTHCFLVINFFTGIQHVAPVDEMPLEKWNDLIQVNLTTPFILSKHVVPAMKMKGMCRTQHTCY